MPRMMTDDSMETMTIGTMQAFQFSGKRIDKLTAVEYTLATIAVDVTGSVSGFEKELRATLVTAVESCKKSPRANNLLVRVILFSTSSGSNGIEEIHGFKPLGEIDVADYPQLHPSGGTPLFDAVFSAVGATNAYAATLMAQEFLANGIVIVITDGDDTSSHATPAMIKTEIDRGTKGETIESLITILVGVNSGTCGPYLDKLSNAVGMKFLDAGAATPGKLAKLAEFVSQSVSSQSQSLGTGGPSQAIAPTI